jgi:four helix bundle protein
MRKPAQNFQELIAWRKAHQFVLDVYGYTNCFSRAEKYGLTAQLRKAAISIPANIAEGLYSCISVG